MGGAQLTVEAAKQRLAAAVYANAHALDYQILVPSAEDAARNDAGGIAFQQSVSYQALQEKARIASTTDPITGKPYIQPQQQQTIMQSEPIKQPLDVPVNMPTMQTFGSNTGIILGFERLPMSTKLLIVGAGLGASLLVLILRHRK